VAESTRGGAPVVVGNGQGFWGDSAMGPRQLVDGAGIHYLTMDFLAEVTMSIMQKMRSRNPSAGYATDFVALLEQILPQCVDQGIRIIASAGGVNPTACAEACAAVVRKLGIDGVRIATVAGDDVLGELEELLSTGEPLTSLDTGEDLEKHLARVQSANVYLGAAPIVAALQDGADIVITGRVTDPSLTLAPLIHEFGWSMEDYDKLAAGTVAGHILECGTQCTGGNYDRWRDVPRMEDIGYPLVEVHPDGSFVVTKKPGTGGLVDVDTVTAQLLYELGDPEHYLTPDVIADFTSVELASDGPDRVRVSGIRGSTPTDTYKVSISMQGGYKTVAQLTVGGPDAVDKAKLTADILFRRLAAEGVEFPPGDKRVELVGHNVLYENMIPAADEPSEVLLRIAVRAPERRGPDRLGAELAALLTSGPPGLTGFGGGRPRASEIVAYWPALISKQRVHPVVQVEEVTL
jgi:hypothetical protein